MGLSALAIAIVFSCPAAFAAPAIAQTAPPIRIAGTTNLQPLLTQAAKDYMVAHPGVTIEVSATSSGEGVAALKAGSIDVAASDVDARDSDLGDSTIGRIGFAFITGSNSGVTNLTRSQLQQIFSGKITNWSGAGGANQPIVLIERQIGSGTRYIFEQTVAKTLIPVKVINNAKDVVGAVDGTPGALSYVATYYLEGSGLTPLTYDGVAPTNANIASGTYAFRATEHLYTSKQPPAGVADFVNYVKSSPDLLQKYGIVPL